MEIYEIDLGDLVSVTVEVALAHNAMILNCGYTNGTFKLWITGTYPNKTYDTRYFEIRPNGAGISTRSKYINTVYDMTGTPYHIFETFEDHDNE